MFQTSQIQSADTIAIVVKQEFDGEYQIAVDCCHNDFDPEALAGLLEQIQVVLGTMQTSVTLH